MKKWTKLMYALLMILIMTACLLPAQKTLAGGPQAEGSIISRVEILGSLTPKAGESAQLDDLICQMQGVHFQAAWGNKKDNFINGQFRAGFKYTLTVLLSLDPGYEWDNAISENDIRVAGKASDVITHSDDNTIKAIFSYKMDGEQTFFVNFNSMGHGKAPEELEIKKGQKIQSVIGNNTSRAWINPTDGMEMTGWYKDSKLTKAFALTDPVNEDLTLYAKWIWIEPTWTVSFAAGGGSGSMKPVLVKKFTEYTLPKCSFKAPEGMEFDSWNKGAVGKKIAIIANTTLTACWKKMPVISFDAGDGSGSMESVAVPSGTEYTLPNCTFIAPKGKEFDRWKQGAVGLKITITADTTLIAQWKEMPVISFDANGGTESMKSVAVPSGTEYTLPKCTFTAPKGKEFDRWDKGAVGDKITITNNTTIKAIWKNWPVISFNTNGGFGSMKSVAVPSGTEYTLPECTFQPKFGWIFDRWDKGAVGGIITITGNTTIKAIWREIPVIYFYANGGTGTMESVEVPSGEYTLPVCTFTAPEGKEFDKWNLGAVGETISIKLSAKLMPVWKDSSNSSAKPGDILKNAGGIEGQEVLIITPSQVSYTQAPAKSVVTIPSTIKSNGRTYKVTSVEKNAFSRTKARTVIVGKNVKKLKKGAFANSKVKKIILKTKLLRKKTVKGSLKKSKVKTIKVKVGKKKTNKKYVKKYKKIFKKKYSGKKAKVTK